MSVYLTFNQCASRCIQAFWGNNPPITFAEPDCAYAVIEVTKSCKLARIVYFASSTMLHKNRSVAALLSIAIVLSACTTALPFHDWDHRLQTLSQYGGTKRDVSMMFGSAPKHCQAVPGRQYLLGINFDSARGSNHINFVQANSPAHKLGIKAGERVSSIDGKHVSNYADIRKVLPEPLSTNRQVIIRTDSNTYAITPGLAMVEQCYWDTRDGTMSDIEKDHSSPQAPQQRFFRATCRIIEGYVTACSRDLQDSSTNM